MIICAKSKRQCFRNWASYNKQYLPFYILYLSKALFARD